MIKILTTGIIDMTGLPHTNYITRFQFADISPSWKHHKIIHWSTDKTRYCPVGRQTPGYGLNDIWLI